MRPYLNHEDCWKTLQLAAKDARYLGLVGLGGLGGLGELEDHRIPPPHLYLSRRAQAVQARVTGGLWQRVFVPRA